MKKGIKIDRLSKDRTQRFLVALIVVLSACFVALEWSDYQPSDFHLSLLDNFDRDLEEVVAAEEEKEMASQPPPEEETPVVTDDVKPVEKTKVIQEVKAAEILEKSLNTGKTPKMVEKKKIEVPDSLPNEDVPPNDSNSPQPVLIDKSLNVVEKPDEIVLPVFPGGALEFAKWLTNNLQYPPMAKSQKIEGEVRVRFYINEDGSIARESIVKSVHPLLDNEALRVVRLMPKWSPARMHGKAVKTQFTIPIIFKI